MKSQTRRMCANYTAAGSEIDGLYAVVAHRISGRAHGRITIGTSGSSIAVQHRAGNGTNEADHDLKAIHAPRESASLQAPLREQVRFT